MITDDVQAVLKAIFGVQIAGTEWSPRGHQLVPTFDDVVALAELLAVDAPEETLQQLLSARPQLLMGAAGYGQNDDLAFFTKPPVGPSFFADFGILSYDQGGCDVTLIELERASAALFTKNGEEALALRTARRQVNEWDEWIQRNRTTYVSDTLAAVTSLSTYPAVGRNGSFALRPPPEVEAAWRGFGGYDHPKVRFTIVAGKWSALTDDHRRRLLHMNHQENRIQVRTYEQLIRRALGRPFIHAY